MLLLPPVPQNLKDTLPETCSSVATLHQKYVEPAGYSYHLYCIEKLGLSEAFFSSTSTTTTAKKKTKIKSDEEEKQDMKNNLSLQEAGEDVNLYEVLGLKDLNFQASQKQIKKAYQKQLLIHHPDKQAKNKSEEFLLVQKAFDILGDPKKRRGYDSMLDFDDWIPTGTEDLSLSESQFFDIYKPIFESNARFSVHKPVPSIGDSSSPMDKVHNFYRFWDRFESWREFSKFDEFKDGDIENAETRYEKRWMMKKNQSIRAKKKKEEYERIRNLVQRSKKNDPRILRLKEIEKKKKEEEVLKKEKEAQEEEDRKKEEARVKKLADEAREKKEEERRREKRKLKEKFDALEKKLIEKLSALAKPENRGYVKVKVEYVRKDFINKLKNNETGCLQLIEELLKEKDQPLVKFNKIIQGLKKHEEEEKKARTVKIGSKQKEEKGGIISAPWSEKELSWLAKGLKKFPGGSRKRWSQIAEFVNVNCSQYEGKERTPEHCVQKVKSLGQNKNTTEEKSKDEESWTAEEQKKLEEGLKKFPAKLEKNERWGKISELVGTKSKKQCVQRFKQLRAQLLAKKGKK
eukprot:snap_masked-scaffold_26-processed-gene-4.94-mRNA-1 protein AED:0.08 eAED:0.08 QI:0/-1/0/1/-1/1/1/0/573